MIKSILMLGYKMFRQNQLAWWKHRKNWKKLSRLRWREKTKCGGAELLDNESLINQTASKIDEHEKFTSEYSTLHDNRQTKFCYKQDPDNRCKFLFIRRFKIMNKDSATITKADVPEGWIKEDTRNSSCWWSDPFKDWNTMQRKR